MKDTKLTRLAGRYLEVLRAYLAPGAPATLGDAHDLGVRAVAVGLETLELARLHDQSLEKLIPAGSTAAVKDALAARAVVFFTEVIVPVEGTHRHALEAGASLTQLNATLARRTLALEESQRDLQHGVALRQQAEEALKISGKESGKLLEESRDLGKHLQDLAHQILTSSEEERRKMSLTLQDDVAQTLFAIHVRLLALDKGLTASTEDFKKQIANVQMLVEKSVKVIQRFAREFDIVYEN